MIKFEPPYSVYMLEKSGAARIAMAEAGVVYSSGNPAEAQAFAQGLYDTGGSVVEVRDSAGRLVVQFPLSGPAIGIGPRTSGPDRFES